MVVPDKDKSSKSGGGMNKENRTEEFALKCRLEV